MALGALWPLSISLIFSDVGVLLPGGIVGGEVGLTGILLHGSFEFLVLGGLLLASFLLASWTACRVSAMLLLRSGSLVRKLAV